MARFIKHKELIFKNTIEEPNEYAEEVYLIIDTKTNKEYELNNKEDIELIVEILNRRESEMKFHNCDECKGRFKCIPYQRDKSINLMAVVCPHFKSEVNSESKRTDSDSEKISRT